jgi:hypothetical protein
MRIYKTTQSADITDQSADTPASPSVATPLGKIPETIDGHPVPQQVKQIIQQLDNKYHLTEAEVEWVLTSLETDYHFFSIDALSAPSWDIIGNQLDHVFSWAREFNKNLIGTRLGDAAVIADSHFVNARLLQSFSGQKWIMALLNNKDNQFREEFAQLNDSIPNGLTQEEALWLFKKGGLAQEIMLGASTKTKYSNIIKWSRETGTKLSTINDGGTARTLADEWSDYQRKLKLSKRLSKRSLKTVRLSGKWKAVWVDPQAVAKEDPSEIGRQFDPRRDFQGDYDHELEQEITGLENSGKIISIRDPNGVPQASIDIGDESNERIDVLDLISSATAKKYVKEFVAKMKAAGTKLWWAGDPEGLDDIKDINNYGYDEYGLVPSVSLRNVGNIQDTDSYRKALELAYNKGWGNGSYYYESTANNIVDALLDYAEQRGELHLLGHATEAFEGWAQDQWGDVQFDIMRNNSDIPPYPDGDDQKYYRGGKFNAKKYDADMAAYDAALQPYEEEFEPFRFCNTTYKKCTSRREAPENKAYYDEIDRKETAEAERRRRQKEEEDFAIAQRDFMSDVGQYTKMVEHNLPDDFGENDRDVLASVIDPRRSLQNMMRKR